MSVFPWFDPDAVLADAAGADSSRAVRALNAKRPRAADLAVLLSSVSAPLLEAMALRARRITRRHFGNTVGLYAPLYISNYCGGGCVYCGFASDRRQRRRKLDIHEVDRECAALKRMGLEDILLLTGERLPCADVPYIRQAVTVAARHVHSVGVETFAMDVGEYRYLAHAGCSGVTLYQETYDRSLYSVLHRWGEKRDFAFRVDAPSRALSAGIRRMGMGVLLGLADPVRDCLSLYLHVQHLRSRFWRAELQVSFPRLCPEQGGFKPRVPVKERFLAQAILAFRICLPDVPIVLSTRERPGFRDGMAGLGVSRMSVASRTGVGGYTASRRDSACQFEVTDTRDVPEFCRALRKRGLRPVFKNWHRVFRDTGEANMTRTRGHRGRTGGHDGPLGSGEKRCRHRKFSSGGPNRGILQQSPPAAPGQGVDTRP